MNKRDAINHIRQFGGRLDRFRKSVGGSGDGGRNAPKRAKSSPKPVNRKTNVFNEQVRYAFHGALQDLKSKPFATFFNGDGYRHLPDAALASVIWCTKNVNQCGDAILSVTANHCLSAKKRWMMTPLRAWWHSCRPSKAWRK